MRHSARGMGNRGGRIPTAAGLPMRIRLPPSRELPDPPEVNLDRHSDFTTFYETFIENCYGPLLELIVPGDVVVDAGANIGLFTLLASRRVGPKGIVVALEPNPENFARLQAHVEQNGVTNVRAFQLAVGSRNDQVAGMVGEGIRAHLVPLPHQGYQVRTITLDELARREAVRPGVLKMDIEGSEVEAFNGMIDCLASIRAVAIEVHDPTCAAATERGLAGFHREPLRRPGYAAYLRVAMHHPLLLPRLELGNRFLSIRRLLGARGQIEFESGGYPQDFLALREPYRAPTTK